MPLFKINKSTLSIVGRTNFTVEKELQDLIERNLEPVFGCRYIATEFSTGPQHAGRIDTLALSEDNNPVIIEYKKTKSSNLVNQSLFYLAWVRDHQGDFEIAVQKALGNEVKVEWSDIRVICLAPNYDKFDLHAVQEMGASLELWTYRLFENDSLYLEEIFRKSSTASKPSSPEGLTPGKKAALTRQTTSYTIEQHFDNKLDLIVDLAQSIREFVLGLDPSMKEAPKKNYIAYRVTQNMIYMKIQQRQVILLVKLDPKEVKLPKGLKFRDMSSFNYVGPCVSEFTVKTRDDFELVKPLLELAYQKVGG